MLQTQVLPLADLTPLRALRQETPGRLITQLHRALPDIEDALSAGHTLKAVHQRLIQSGIKIGYPTLSVYLIRLRRRPPRLSRAPRFQIAPPPPTERRASRDTSIGSSASVQSDDPMTVAREYLSGGKKVPGFHFKEELPNLSELV